MGKVLSILSILHDGFLDHGHRPTDRVCFEPVLQLQGGLQLQSRMVPCRSSTLEECSNLCVRDYFHFLAAGKKEAHSPSSSLRGSIRHANLFVRHANSSDLKPAYSSCLLSDEPPRPRARVCHYKQ